MQKAPPDVPIHNPTASYPHRENKTTSPSHYSGIFFGSCDLIQKNITGNKSVSRKATLFDWSNQGQKMVSCAQDFRELDPGWRRGIRRFCY